VVRSDGRAGASLKARCAELANSLEKASVRCVVPPYLYKQDTIERFRSKLREAFTKADRGVAGTYLRQLVDRIVVGPVEIVIEAKAAEVIAMMADFRLDGRRRAIRGR
jgi:hypothetical protein